MLSTMIVAVVLTQFNGGWASNPPATARAGSWAADPFVAQTIPPVLRERARKSEPVGPERPKLAPADAPSLPAAYEITVPVGLTKDDLGGLEAQLDRLVEWTKTVSKAPERDRKSPVQPAAVAPLSSAVSLRSAAGGASTSAKAASATATLGTTVVAPAPPRWVTYTANPAYEVYGAEDDQGVFRYTASRLKAGLAAPSVPASPVAQPATSPLLSLGNYYNAGGLFTPYATGGCANGQCYRR